MSEASWIAPSMSPTHSSFLKSTHGIDESQNWDHWVERLSRFQMKPTVPDETCGFIMSLAGILLFNISADCSSSSKDCPGELDLSGTFSKPNID